MVSIVTKLRACFKDDVVEEVSCLLFIFFISLSKLSRILPFHSYITSKLFDCIGLDQTSGAACYSLTGRGMFCLLSFIAPLQNVESKLEAKIDFFFFF